MKINLNENFEKMPSNYLFSEIARRIGAEKGRNPSRKIISLGIGDVTRPLPECVSSAMSGAAEKMSTREDFRGYGDARGLLELRTAISRYYNARGVLFGADEIFISDGAKSDLGNLSIWCHLYPQTA